MRQRIAVKQTFVLTGRGRALTFWQRAGSRLREPYSSKICQMNFGCLYEAHDPLVQAELLCRPHVWRASQSTELAFVLMSWGVAVSNVLSLTRCLPDARFHRTPFDAVGGFGAPVGGAGRRLGWPPPLPPLPPLPARLMATTLTAALLTHRNDQGQDFGSAAHASWRMAKRRTVRPEAVVARCQDCGRPCDRPRPRPQSRR